jgi:hypothetical protein
MGLPADALPRRRSPAALPSERSFDQAFGPAAQIREPVPVAVVPVRLNDRNRDQGNEENGKNPHYPNPFSKMPYVRVAANLSSS